MASIGVVAGSADHVQPALLDAHVEHTGRQPSHCETKTVSPQLRSHLTHTGRSVWTSFAIFVASSSLDLGQILFDQSSS
jgi:hypothetical protein